VVKNLIVEKIYPEIKTIVAKLVTDKPVKKTPYQVKGVLMRLFPEEEITPMLDGRYRDKFLYPRVQVKILNEQIYLVGLSEGVDPIKSIVSKFDSLDFGNITFQLHDIDVEEDSSRFKPVDKLIRYRFITPWVALNQTTGSKYRFLNNKEKLAFLNRLMGQNIVFLAREMGIELEEKIYTKTSLDSLFPKPVDENNWGAFMGEFRTNFILPNYLGIGNGITRGYGTVFSLFNPDMFNFDENSLEKGKLSEEVELIDTSDETIESVSTDEVPKPKKRLKKTRGKSPRAKKEKKHKRFPKKPEQKKEKHQEKHEKHDPDDDNRFNTAEHHSKQHDF